MNRAPKVASCGTPTERLIYTLWETQKGRREKGWRERGRKGKEGGRGLMVEDDFEEYHDLHLKKGREGKAKGFAA